MATCPNCGKEISKPDKVLENCYFCIKAYTCKTCGDCFKETHDRNEHTNLCWAT